MNYFIAIKTAIFLFPVIALFFTSFFILQQYHKYGSINKFRVLIIYSFILYMLVIYFLVILPLPNINDVKPPAEFMRLIPFSFVSDFLTESSFVLENPKTYLKSITEPSFYVVIFNVLMTIPFGMYLRYYFKFSFKKTILYGLLLSLFFELTQLTGLYFLYPYPYRLFDIDDLILNVTGVSLGYLFTGSIKRYLPARDEIDKDSKEAGKNVSGLRRITIFFLDAFLYLLITLFFSFFFNFNYVKYFVFFVYYIVIPIVLKGMTLGSKFLNVKLEYTRNNVFMTTLRIIFLYLYYFIVPFKFLIVFFKRDSLLFLIVFLSIFIFYLANFFVILKQRKNFYDSLFGITYISTINIL